MNDMNRLNDNALDQVSGGAIFEASGISGHDPKNPWEVLNEKGEVLDRAATRDDAIWLAGKNGVSRDEVTWDDVLKMRGLK
ncbi:MAG: hypothetical protein K5985_11475 [Lachnospiraceae bacterium]|nr:hypothetical protein [Lachnospiraceae bacterium]